MSLRCLILDDQTMFLQLLAGMVRTTPGLDLVGVFSEVTKARDYVSQNAVDLLILEIGRAHV